MERESFLGLEVRANDGTDLGRVTDVITDGATGEVTHLVLKWGGVDTEVAVSAVALDEDGEFATYSPDASDVEPGDHVGDEYKPGDHVGDEYEPGGYSPAWEAIPDQEDYERQGQFVHLGDLDEPTVSPAQVAREDWEDESYEPDSGYPENDAFIDEQTGEETYAYRDGEDLRADVAEVLDSTEVYDDTGIRLRRIIGSVVVLGGAAASREDLDAVVAEILDLDGVADVDTTDVDVRWHIRGRRWWRGSTRASRNRIVHPGRRYSSTRSLVFSLDGDLDQAGRAFVQDVLRTEKRYCWSR